MRRGLIYVILGLFGMSAICRAQITDGGWYNTPDLKAPWPTEIDSNVLESVTTDSGAKSLGVDSVPVNPIAEAITPNIQALASGLQNDPVRILNYVHDHIRFSLYFGSKKGAELTLLEKSGNDFDQCALLMALLRASGYTNAQYQFGWMLFPYDIPDGTDRDIHHWLRLTLTNTPSTWLATSNYLAQLMWVRGYPSYAMNWGNNVFAFQHVWVTMTSGSTTNYLDPSFKVSEPIAGVELIAALGFASSSALSNALMSAAGGQNHGDYVTNMTEATLRSALSGYATNYLNYLQGNCPNASVQEVLTGWRIVPSTNTTLPQSLFFTTTDFGGILPILTWNNEPTNLMSKLTVSFAGTNHQWYMPEFQGQRLALTYSNNGVAQLWQDDTPLAQKTATASDTNVVMNVHHPVGNWNPTNNTFIDNGAFDQVVTNSYQRTNSTYALLYAFEPDWGWLRQRQDVLDRYRQQGWGDNSRQVISETLNIMGLNWALQCDAVERMLAARLNIMPGMIHRLGRMAQESGNGYYVDAYMQFSAPFPNSGWEAVSAERYNREYELKAYFASALEHGVIEQFQNTNLTAASTVKMLQLANTNKQAVYMAYSGNWSAGFNVRGKLAGYGAAGLSKLDNLVNAGYFILLPQNGSNHIAGTGSWAGYGYVVVGNGISMLIGGGYHGGFSSDPASTPNPPFASLVGQSQPNFATADPVWMDAPPVADPVDTADGTFQVAQVDLALGQSEPRGIAFSRYYNGTRRYANPSGISGGWVHNYSATATAAPAPQACLGLTTPAQAAAMAVATCAAVAVYDDTIADPKNWMMGVLIAKWGVDQLTRGGVSLSLGKDTVQFVRQPNGVFTPPANCTMTLTQGVNANYILRERHGNNFFFDSLGRLTNITDQYSQSLAVSYLSVTSSLPQTVTDWKNRTLTFNYNSGTLTNITDGTGRRVGFGYTLGDLTSVSDPENKTSTFVYDTNHQITGVFNALSQLVVSNVYDSLGHVTTQYMQGDPSKTWKVFWSGWQTVEQDPTGSQRMFFFDDQSRLVASRDQLGNLSQTVYDGQNHTVMTVSPLGETNRFVYDGRHNLIATVDPLGFSNQMVYDAKDSLIRLVDQRGNTNRFGYNGQFSLTGRTNGTGDWVALAYNGDGTLFTRTDPAGTTTYGYDSFGQLNSLTYPGGLGSESFGNSAVGDVTNHVNGRGFATAYQYNSRRQLTNTIAPTNLTAKIFYDGAGNRQSVTDARANTTTLYWSPTRQPTGTILPSTPQGAPTITNFYDARDWLFQSIANPGSSVSATVTSTNDAAGRQISVTDPLSRTTRFGYDNDGRQIAATNAALEATGQRFNSRGERVQLTDPASHTVLSLFDGAGNQITLTNRRSKVWRFGYDAANRRNTTTTPLGRTNLLVFDNRGLLRTNIDGKGQQTVITYDAKGRISIRTDAVGTNYFGHDANDNLTSVAENGRTNFWTFDAYDRIYSCTDADGNLIQYRYDANGNLTSLIYPGGRAVTYAFDSLNRLTNVTDWANRVTSITYDLASRVKSITRPNNTVRLMNYDVAGEVMNIVEKGLNNFPIAFFSLGWTNSGRVAWEFSGPLPQTNSVPLRAIVFNDDNQIATFNGQTVIHDNNGNMTTGPLTNNTLTTYVFDARNRLSGVGGFTYGYDPAGNRTSVTNGTNVVRFMVNPNAKIPQTLIRARPDGSQTFYVYGQGLLYEVNFDSGGTELNTRTYHYDLRGSTVAITDGTGLPTDRIEYSLYGSMTRHLGSTDTPFLYNGRYGVMTDANGLLYMRARYYNPYICRFINADPAGFSGGLNFYAFAGGNPVSSVDPFGLSPSDFNTGSSLLDSVLDSTEKAGEQVMGAVTKVSEQALEIGIKLLAKDLETLGRAMDPGSGGADGNPIPLLLFVLTDGESAVILRTTATAERVAAAETTATRATQLEFQFAKDVGSSDVTYLYQKVGAQGEHLKFGITVDPATRYTAAELNGGRIRIIAQGENEEMLSLERQLHETLPIGPEEGQKFYIQKQVQKGLKPPPY